MVEYIYNGSDGDIHQSQITTRGHIIIIERY